MTAQLKSPYSAFTYKYPQRQRAIITPCQVSNPLIRLKFIESKGLWDTGATNSAISKNLATKLQLRPIDQKEIRGVHGSEMANVYLIDIGLPQNRVVFKSLNVSEANLGSKIDIIIGMDIIGSCDFALCAGKVFSYCNPPFDDSIDFVEKAKSKGHGE